MTTLVYAIAAVKDLDPLEAAMPPLYESIDAQALEDTFFGPSGATDREEGNWVSFEYTDLLVSLTARGSITMYQQR